MTLIGNARLDTRGLPPNEKASALAMRKPFQNDLNSQQENSLTSQTNQLLRCHNRKCRREMKHPNLLVKQSSPSQPVTVIALCNACVYVVHYTTFIAPRHCDDCGDDLRNFVEVHERGSQVICDTCAVHRPSTFGG